MFVFGRAGRSKIEYGECQNRKEKNWLVEPDRASDQVIEASGVSFVSSDLSSFGKIVAARLVHLLVLRPRVFPAHGRPEFINCTNCPARVVVLKFQKRAFIQEHAACAAAFAFTRPAAIHRQR